MSRGRWRCGLFAGHRIVAATTPRMASAKAFGRQQRPVYCAVPVNGLDGILRTGGREPATLHPAEQKGLHRRKRAAIDPDRQNQCPLKQVHFEVHWFNSLTGLPGATQPENLFPWSRLIAGDRIPCHQHQFWLGQLMLMQPETFPEQTPCAAALHRSADLFARHNASISGSRFQLAMRQPRTRRWPDCRTRAKSRLCASRDLRPRRRRFGATFTKSDRSQALATLAAAVVGWPCRSW